MQKKALKLGNIIICFIIPALNEEENIGKTIESIKKCLELPDAHSAINSYEIIVVDNGSTDRTQEICNSEGAKLIIKPGGTIGGLRNLGAAAATGDLFVFIDADVILTQRWAAQLKETVRLFIELPNMICGSRVTPDESVSFSMKLWFSMKKTCSSENYINSGHMIISKDFFSYLGGFNESLISGEDSEFCQRAISNGALLKPLESLEVVHNAMPSNMYEFFKRERWHGYGDFQSINNFKKSKPALIAFLNFILLIFSAILFFYEARVIVIYLFVLSCLSLFSALHKNNYKLDLKIPVFSYIYVVYITARSFSLLDNLFGFEPKRWR